MGSEVLYASGYGFTLPMQAPIDARSRPRLTVAACLVLPEVRMILAGPFIRTIRYMIDLYLSRPIVDDEAPNVILRSTQLTQDVPGLSPWFVKVLPDLLSNEPAISTGGAHIGGGAWEREVTRPIIKFAGVATVEDFVAKTTDMVMVVNNEFVQTPVEDPEPTVVEPERAPYVDPVLLDDITAAAQGTKWRVHKLVALCEELNDNYVWGRPYSSAALVRAILDHIPPVFGKLRGFQQVAAEYAFRVAQTDKAHAQRLAAFKEVAHDVMHRPISATVPTLSMGDLPEPVRLNAMFQELLAILHEESTAGP
ncbi:hypothetical protein [Streptomyces sp. NPDC004658]|uniref:hypothetical protein n=1 Tax=Streptomyces sp. NPDC004658 TaxID=3154672 RepID=UPI00339F7DBB